MDLSDIQLPSPSGTGANAENDDVNQYWAKAQVNLQKISTPQQPGFMSYPPAPPQFYPPGPQNMYSYMNPALLAQGPSMFPPRFDALAESRRLAAEQRLRDVMPRGAVINPIVRPNNFGGNQHGGMIRQPRAPRPSFTPRMQVSPVTVAASDGNFVYSDFFSRMVPESVSDFVRRSYDALPTDSMKPQLEFYLRERIMPLLDSGIAAKINWDSEPLPHKIGFEVSKSWTPLSKPNQPRTGANSVEVSRSNKRPFSMPMGNNSSSRFEPVKNPLNGAAVSSEPLSKKDRKKLRKQEQLMEARHGNAKLQKFMSQGIGFIKEGEDAEAAQRRHSRSMRFHEGTSNSTNVTPLRRTFTNTPREGTLAQRFSTRKPNKKTDDDALAYLDRQQIERDLAELQGTYCPSTVEKYQLLLKRDNLLSLLAKLRPKSAKSRMMHSRLGNCSDMCPEKERYCRIVGNLLHPYECDSNGKINHALAVKDYSRSAADQDEPLPHELRPPQVLQKTMDYLILKIDKSMPRAELGRWYDFTWSRTRAIRKDLTQQMIVDNVTVSLVEKCARFHIYASFCMSSFDAKVFDGHTNTENLSKCLQTLRHMYDDLTKKSIYCASEAEFRSYDILLNLADSNVLSMTHTYRKEVREAPIFKFAVKLVCYFHTDNYIAFFRLIRDNATFLQACLCRTFFSQIRMNAIQIMLKIAKPTKVSVSSFVSLLGFDDREDAVQFMKLMKITPGADDLVSLNKDFQSVKELPADAKGNYGCQIIEGKLRGPLPNIIAGGRVSTPTFPQPTNSFVFDYYGRAPTGVARRR